MLTSSTTSPEMGREIRSPPPRLTRVAGFSLIELMVAMVLGLLVVAGLINLFVANRRAYQIQSGNNFLQENIRIASDRMSWSLRMADYWGGNKSVDINSSATGAITSTGTCTGTWATAINPTATDGGAVRGYDGAATFPLGSTCVATANYLAGSDVLVVRYADSQTLSPGPAEAGFAPAESTTISSNPKQVFLLSTPGTSAQLFAGAPPTTTTIKAHRYVNPYQVDVFYLRPCSVIPTGSTVCTAAADGGQPLPTLMRMHLDSTGKLVSEPVVDGIEQINFEYGVATLSTNSVPQYASGADITAANSWASVISVRVSLVAVNPTRDISIPHKGTYTLGTLGKCSYTINVGAAATTTGCHSFTAYGNNPWQFARTDQQFVVQLRNRVRGT